MSYRTNSESLKHNFYDFLTHSEFTKTVVDLVVD